jgi:DNA-binding SARP family transcriptional activator
MSDLLIRLFGPFEASLESRALTHFRTAKVQALLVYLVTEPSAAHQREALMTLLWPDLPLESAQINLRQILYQLRRSIPEVASVDGGGRVPLLLSERQTVQINPAAAVHVDARAFAAHLEDVRRHAHADWLSCPTCTQRLEAAVALYRGPFLADFYLEDSNEFEDWAHRRREAYRRQVMDTLAALGEIHLRRGDHVAAQSVARRQLELDDLDERAARQLMEALAREGRRGEALTTYDELRRRLHDELAMAPSA